MTANNKISKKAREPESSLLWIRLSGSDTETLPDMPKGFELVSKDQDSFLFAGPHNCLLYTSDAADE